MKPLFRKVPVKLQQSFAIRHDVKPYFTGSGHYHAELELHYVIKGDGARFIDDTVSNFSSGEIVLLGENLPHCWRSTKAYYEQEMPIQIEVIVINFLPDFLGKHFLNMPEGAGVVRLIEKAKGGLEFYGGTRNQLAELMKEALTAAGLERLIIMLKILKVLSATKEVKQIVKGQKIFPDTNELDSFRLNKIFEYTLSNFTKDITLDEVAALSNLGVTSFCRYFKTITQKTYYDFLIEVRIQHACKLLAEDKIPIDMVCFNCGFHNISNFYRHFKKVMGTTPRDYKKTYLKTTKGFFMMM